MTEGDAQHPRCRRRSPAMSKNSFRGRQYRAPIPIRFGPRSAVAPSLALAPWTPDQVHRLNDRQNDPTAAYRCPGDGVELFATRLGWMCAVAGCYFTQDWAMDVHVNGLPLVGCTR